MVMMDISTMPVTVIPRVKAGVDINDGVGVIIIGSGIVPVRIGTVIAPDPDSHAHTHSGIGLTGETQYSQEYHDWYYFFHNNLLV
jgi:hypothetical protein